MAELRSERKCRGCKVSIEHLHGAKRYCTDVCRDIAKEKRELEEKPAVITKEGDIDDYYLVRGEISAGSRSSNMP